MGIRKRILHALENAPVTDGYVTTNDFSVYTDKGDDHPVRIGEEFFHDLPNEVTFDMSRPLALMRLLEAYDDVADTPVGLEYAEYAQRHEDEHFRAARHLGALGARVGLHFLNVRSLEYEPEITVQPFLRLASFKTTKLGAALVSAYPFFPSTGDEIDVKAYGYSGIDELADRAMRRNRAIKNPTSEQSYLIPLSVKSTSEKRSFFIAGPSPKLE